MQNQTVKNPPQTKRTKFGNTDNVKAYMYFEVWGL